MFPLSYANRSETGSVFTCQLFCPDSDGYTDRSSLVAHVTPGNWTPVEFDVPVPAGPLRLDPANCGAVIEIADMVVESRSTGNVLWRLKPGRTDEISCGGTAVLLPDEGRLIVVSYGNDPQLLLPALNTSDTETGLRLHFRVRIDPDFGSITELCQKYSDVRAEAARLREEVEVARQLATALARVSEEIETARQLTAGLTHLSRQYETVQKLLADRRRAELESASLREGYRAALSDAAAVRQSASWRITAPLRRLASLFLPAKAGIARRSKKN